MPSPGQRDFDKILGLLRQHTGVDFAHYKHTTLRRRTERRMVAHKLKSLGEYFDHLRRHPAEIDLLFNDVLIQVTGFFRDLAVFQTLREKHFLPLVRANISNGPIRIWVPGCATGEEVYSLAILLVELMARRKDLRPVQIFGTDINEKVLEKARAGFYPETIREQVSPTRLLQFFEPVPGGYQVRKIIRDLCIFARHNFTTDPPFSNLDLISCRNVLIYFSPVLQQKVAPLFHYALRATGILMLGTSEAISRLSDLFLLADKKAKIYSKKKVSGKIVAEAGRFLPSVHTLIPLVAPPMQGFSARHNKQLRPGELNAAVAKAIQQNIGAQLEHARIVPLTLPHTADKFYLIFVDPKGPADPRENQPTGPESQSVKHRQSGAELRIRDELLKTRQSLQAVIEQEGATNEELRAANEEIISSNEELQSTNEELETAKEELQSTNQELATLNHELENRNLQLEQANAVSRHYTAIVESSDDAIISKNLNSIILSWNKGAEKIFGYTAAEIIGKPVTILIPPDHPDEEPSILARLRAGERIEHYETVRKCKDGRLIDVSLTVSPIKNSAGQVAGASKIARDITDKKRHERELQQAHEAAEKASRAKDDFLATLSHELRTPLNPVLLVASDAAANLELPPGVRANFDMIRRNVEMEARLIDDMLDLTRISCGKLKLEKRGINVQGVLTTTISMLQSDIEQKKIRLEQTFNASPGMILGDSIRLQQVFWNVLKNAIKFTPSKGVITIETRSKNGEYIVSVSDTGVGMTAPELELAFNAFSHGNHSEFARRFGGLGLGLTITKRLVELHSGGIEAASEGRNRGSTFTIRFPLAEWKEEPETDSPPTESQSKARPPGLRILLVEDHEPTRTALARLLVTRRHDVSAVGTVQEALALADKMDFDLVVSDIGLPDGTGYDLFKQIRKQLPSVKGLALTGYGMETDVSRSQDAGFHAHLTKPARIQSLETALKAAMSA